MSWVFALVLSIAVSVFWYFFNRHKNLQQIEKLKKQYEEQMAKVESEYSKSKTMAIQEMIDEIVELMDSQKDKVRMEKELKTAREVQEFMGYGQNFKNKDVSISVYHHSSSECSGDWWYFGEMAGKTYIMIGDATGHGVPAALLTATVKSAVGLLEVFPRISPTFILNILNKTVFQASKGKINMTFLVMEIDRNKSQLTYANASHEPAVMLTANGEAKMLTESIGPRLGDELEISFKQTEIALPDKGTLVFYTDGVFEFIDEKKRPLSEMRFLKLLKSIYTKGSPQISKSELFRQELEENGLKLAKTNQRSNDDIAVLFIDLI